MENHTHNRKGNNRKRMSCGQKKKFVIFKCTISQNEFFDES